MLTINFLNLNKERFNKLDFAAFQTIFALMLRHRHKLFDDEYFAGNKPYIERVYDVKTGEILGFCYFYDIVPGKNHIYSAFASICFAKKALGMRAYVGAKRLMNHMFRELKVTKIKAECYSDNLLVPNFLAKLDFQHEATLKCETIVQNRPKDIEIWSIFNPDFKIRHLY